MPLTDGASDSGGLDVSCCSKSGAVRAAGFAISQRPSGTPITGFAGAGIAGAAGANGVRLTASVAASAILPEEGGAADVRVGASVGRRSPKGGGPVRAGKTGGGKLGITCGALCAAMGRTTGATSRGCVRVGVRATDPRAFDSPDRPASAKSEADEGASIFGIADVAETVETGNAGFTGTDSETAAKDGGLGGARLESDGLLVPPKFVSLGASCSDEMATIGRTSTGRTLFAGVLGIGFGFEACNCTEPWASGCESGSLRESVTTVKSSSSRSIDGTAVTTVRSSSSGSTGTLWLDPRADVRAVA